MRVDAVELRQLELPMVEPMAAAHGVTTSRLLGLVRVITDVGEGWGECVALNEPTYVPAWNTGEYTVLKDVFIPALLELDDVTPENVLSQLGRFRGHHPAKSAIEMALLDADLRARNASLASHLGAQRTMVECCVVIGLSEGDAMLRSVEQKLQHGFRQIKLKIAPGRDIARMDSIKSHFPDLAIRVDANGSYRWDQPKDREALFAIDERRPVAIEQPLPPEYPLWYKELHDQLQSVISLDESITSISDGLYALDTKICDAVVIKPSMLGGYRAAKQLHDECESRGIAALMGGMIDGCLSRSANLAVAALPAFEGHPAEIAPDGRWFSERINVQPVEMTDGRLDVPSGPGLGVDMDMEIVKRLTRRMHVARRGN